MRYPLFVLALCAAAAATAAPAPPVAYQITRSVPLGAPDGWDYLFFEPQTHRVYVAHAGSGKVSVMDGMVYVADFCLLAVPHSPKETS